MSVPQSFRIQVTDAAIADLHERIDRTRWPDEVQGVGWRYGTPKAYLQELVQYWRKGYDWRRAEAGINRYTQLQVPIDGLDIHCIHERSPHAGAIPLLLCHGWPGSIVEFLDTIPRLTHPEKFGGRAEDAFHVVCPSLPGYGYSAAATEPGMSPRAIALRHDRLMTTLGYDRYIAQGGDWGAMVTLQMGELATAHCRAIHLNMLPTMPPEDVADPMALATPAERQALQDYETVVQDGFGYYHQQRTRPQTLAYALNDSPVGLCGWITEKFHAWTDCGGEIRNAMSWDTLLTNISLYWFSGSIGSSVRLYLESGAGQPRARGFPLAKVTVPVGAAIYPKELIRPPRAWAERQYPIAHWFEADRGGHFAALEQPQIFSADLWEFRRKVADRFTSA